MVTLRPIRGHLVAQDRAHRVVTPPYDALDPATRDAIAASVPDSYLGALPPGGEVADLDAALQRCRDHLERLLTSGPFTALPGPCLLVIGLGTPPDRALAVVGDVEVDAFTDGQVLAHEAVRDERVDELTRYLEVVGVASSPVAITHRPHAEVEAATAEVVAGPPQVAYRAEADATAPDGIDVAVWVVEDPALQGRLTAAIAAAGTAYVADGHHRAAAARRHAASLGTDHPTAARVLTAVLPSDHLAVRPFHRRLDPDPAPPDVEIPDHDQLRRRLEEAGIPVTDLPGPAPVTEPSTCHLVVDGYWLHLDLRAHRRDDDPVEALDVRLVERVVVPIVAPGVDPTSLVPIADPLAPDALVADGSLGLALHAPDVDEVLRIADAGRTVPPKTTYVVPKLRSGLVVSPRGPHAPGHAAYPGS